MSYQVQVQLVQITDPAAIAHALTIMREEFLPAYPWFGEWLEGTRADLERGKRRLYAIDDARTRVGLFLINPIDAKSVKASAMIICPRFRGHGYSKAAYYALFELLRPAVEVVFTQCKEGNVVARGLIEGVGFQPIGRLRHVIERSSDNLVYARPLTEQCDRRMCLEKARMIYTVSGVKEFVGPGEGV